MNPKKKKTSFHLQTDSTEFGVRTYTPTGNAGLGAGSGERWTFSAGGGCDGDDGSWSSGLTCAVKFSCLAASFFGVDSITEAEGVGG